MSGNTTINSLYTGHSRTGGTVMIHTHIYKKLEKVHLVFFHHDLHYY